MSLVLYTYKHTHATMYINIMKVSFFLRPNNGQPKKSTIYCRVTVNETTAEFSTKEKIDPGNWRQKYQTFESKNKAETSYINTYLDQVKYKLKTNAMLSENRLITAKEIIYSLERKEYLVFVGEVVRKYIENEAKTKKIGTIRNHNAKLANLEQYEKAIKLKLTNESFTLPEAEKFKQWFQETRETNNLTTANRNVLFYKQALQWAAKQGLIKDYRLFVFRGEKDKRKEIVFLTDEEVEKILKYEPTARILERVKDLYLFQIVTGLSYGDIWSTFKITDGDEGKSIQGARFKTGEPFLIPLNDLALLLLEKYNYRLPVYSNVTYNETLKLIAATLGINKTLTTHIGRKTFATIMEENGWDRVSISMMLGHKSIKTTEDFYLGKSFKRIQNEMRERGGK